MRSEPAPRTNRVPIWIVAPKGRDAGLLRTALMESEDDIHISDKPATLAEALSRPEAVGVLVLTQEALGETVPSLSDFLIRQPAWAELPLILLADGPGHVMPALEKLQAALPRTKLLLLQRPVQISEVQSAVEIMRLSRERQYALRDYIERQDRLRRELNHRVKNILATVQALYGLTLRNADDLRQFSEVFQGRLAAMSKVHEVLYANDYGQAELGDAIGAVIAPYTGEDRITVTADASLLVSAEVGQALALIVHELLTNAIKYGALSNQTGQIRIAWQAQKDFVLTWTEVGGPPVAPPRGPGYGQTFITATMRGYGGKAEFDYREEGLSVRLEAPLEAVLR
nr:sensor histidine kinase [Parvularcula dongshanensis]